MNLGSTAASIGGESEIRTRASGITRTNPLAGDPLIASWVFLQNLCASLLQPTYNTTVWR